MKKVLLGLGNEKFNEIVREALESHFNVIKDEVLSHKYLEEFIQEQNPDIIIVHDYYLASEKSDPFEKEIEWLQTIERIRRAYDDSKRIAFVCERKQGDPFLSELVNRNVLDIFHNRSLDVQAMIEQLSDQPRYSKVAYLKVEDSSKRYNKHVYDSFKGFEITSPQEKKVEETLPLKPVEEVDETQKQKTGFPKISLPKLSIPTISIKKNEKEEAKPETELHVEKPKSEPVKEKVKIEQEPLKEVTPKKQPREFENFEPEEEVKTKPKKGLFGGLFGGKEEKAKEHIPTMRPRLIAVGSIFPGAGSTFFLHNFTRYLSDKGISCGVLEGINDTDALLALYLSESPPEFDWESVHNLVQQGANNLYNVQKWTVERTMVIPTHNLEKETFTKEHAKEMIYYARQNPLVFVDISHDWNDPISKEAIGMCDELWCITEPNPMYLEVQRKHHQQIYQVSNRVGEENVIVIGNKWGDGVDSQRFPELEIKLPYMSDNPKALSNNIPVYDLNTKPFAPFSKLYDRLTRAIM